MPRIARVVAEDVPHHVTQRGNNRQPVFLNDSDRRSYRKLLAEWVRTETVTRFCRPTVGYREQIHSNKTW